MLFYSQYCDHSKMMISLMNTMDLGVEMICVDVNPKTGKRSPLIRKYNIKEVPSLIYKNKVYVGDSAFKVIEQIASNDITKQEKPVVKDEEILKDVQHFSSEFDGFSDNFSAFGEEKPKPLERSFTFLGGGDDSLIPEKKIKETNKKDVANDFERLLQQRAELNKQQQKVI